MAYIEKRLHPSGSLVYRARIRVKGSPNISETFPSRKLAKEWAARMEAEIRAGRYFQKEERHEKTFGEFIDRYIEKELPKNPKSLPKLKLQLTWWKRQLQDYFLCHIAPSMIAELKEKLLSEKTPRGGLRSPSTANRYLAALSKSFTVGIREWGWLKENPVQRVTKFKEGKARDRFLTKEEIARLLAVCKESKSSHLYAVVLFALSCGARKGEILGLKWQDLNFERATATFKATKNGELRTVPLSPQILECLRSERPKRVVLSEYVFPSHDGKLPADIRTAWENAIEEAGLKDICFHILRHTCASHLTMSGASTLEIAAILGHKTLAMVKRYSHLSITATAKALHRMNGELLGGIG